MSKKSLPRAGPTKLGVPTIMDPALAARHGVEYVHTAVFAIDVDRIREFVEGYEDTRPFGWEVFLLERYLMRAFDPIRRPEHVLLFEDIVLAVLEGQSDALGSQIVFAVWDLVDRELFPKRLEGAFAAWKARPEELREDLDRLFEDANQHARDLAANCLEVALEPPIAAPTREALERMLDPMLDRS